MLGVDEGRVQAELAQDGERLEDLESVALHVADQAEDLLALLLELGLVDAHVACAQLDIDGLLHLGGQLGQHLVLGASPHQGRDPSSQRVEPVRGPTALDGLSVHLGETSGVGVEPGGHDRQERPQIHQAVLDRGAGDGELGGRLEATDALVGLRRVVLDELRLVEDQHLPVDAAVLVELQTEQGVGRHDDPGVAHRLGQRGAASRLGLPDGDHLHARSEPVGLTVPVGDHRGGGDDQEPSIGVLIEHVEEQPERLDGLSQAHVVGQDPAQAIAVQERQPVQAVLLVVAQLGGQSCRGIDGFGGAERLHAGDVVGPAP